MARKEKCFYKVTSCYPDSGYCFAHTEKVYANEKPENVSRLGKTSDSYEDYFQTAKEAQNHLKNYSSSERSRGARSWITGEYTYKKK